MKNFLYWAPRLISILLAAFVTIFAFDVFDEGYTGWKLVLAIFMNLLPTIVTVVFIIIAWKWEKIGGWLFIALGIGFVFLGRFQLLAILIFAFPLLIIGVMFLLHYYKFVKGGKEFSTPSV